MRVMNNFDTKETAASHWWKRRVRLNAFWKMAQMEQLLCQAWPSTEAFLRSLWYAEDDCKGAVEELLKNK